MTDSEIKSEAEDNPAPPVDASNSHPRYKSYRKKYRKMRLEFEDYMETANALFIREHKAWDVARRLQEQNDQLLDIILDLTVELPSSEDRDPKALLPHNLDLDNLLQDTKHTPHDLADNSTLATDLVELNDQSFSESHLPGYMTSAHEDEYLYALDSSLSAIPPTDNLPTDVEAIQPHPRPREKSSLTGADFSLQNPVSVQNWLRKNVPQVFEQQREKDKDKDKDKDREKDKDKDSDKGGEVQPVRRGKKEKDRTLAKQDQPFEGLDDEIGFDPTYDPPPSGSARGKRKRDDGAYRPKGGHSRPVKRKRDNADGDFKTKTGKRARLSIDDGS